MSIPTAPPEPTPRLRRTGGIAAWSVHHPIGVVMLTLAVTVVGLLSGGGLGVDLLPELIYPNVGVRVREAGVPAAVMEEQVTRVLEEQLAKTEGAIRVQSSTREGRSALELVFPYGADIDEALRDASVHLERARRSLPATVDAPVIFKRDPSQLPVLEISVSSTWRDPVELRDWVDEQFSAWFLNTPGVAALEVGGGLKREIAVIPDQNRLAGLGLDIADIVAALERNNLDAPAGRLHMPGLMLGSRTAGRFTSIEEIAALPVKDFQLDGGSGVVRLSEVATVVDGHEDEVLRLRLNGTPGIKVSVQKQPNANTVEVVDDVRDRIAWLHDTGALPGDISVTVTGDQSIYIRHALRNAATAAGGGALLAMLVVYLFLGDLRRTLVVASAIPIAMTLTFSLIAAGGMTLNIMSLGGLALGVGMLVDSTIVMLENIQRHQTSTTRSGEPAVNAALEVNGAIVASTSTNLAAVLPFLFIGGLIGLMFRELIFTLCASILASMVVALTLVPALGGRILIRERGAMRRAVDRLITSVQTAYSHVVRRSIQYPVTTVLTFAAVFGLSFLTFADREHIFLPSFDDGRVFIYVRGDVGITHDEMDAAVRQIEQVLASDQLVSSVFSSVGGFVFGRTAVEASNRASLSVQLVPSNRRDIDNEAWIEQTRETIDELKLAGFRVRFRAGRIRGIRLGHGEEGISLKIQGSDLEVLATTADQVVNRLETIPGIRNLDHSASEVIQEVAIVIDRERAADIGISVDGIGRALRTALSGIQVTDYVEGDRLYPVRVRLSDTAFQSPEDLAGLLVSVRRQDGGVARLGDVASIKVIAAPSQIDRENQRRTVEVTASPAPGVDLESLNLEIRDALADLQLPGGYNLYDAGAASAIREGRRTGWMLLGLAVFLVLVVMAVQYESLRNPVVILFAVPFAASGVGIAVHVLDLPLSMPLWLGLIMLAGIVVNNAIVLVEQIEILRQSGHPPAVAVEEASRLRLRPILMTTLTTVTGMLPLALGFGEGAEMLRPIAIAVASGLSFSMLVTLVLTPAVYRLIHLRNWV